MTSVEPGGHALARVTTTAGELEAELVVAADGLGSQTRKTLFPEHPGLRYAKFTTWRLLADPIKGPVPMAESWGRGTVFGVMPLSDGRVYCCAAAPAPAGARIAAAAPDRVLRLDVSELAKPLPSFHRGRVALLGDAAHPMTPNLGQGACQALEDATVIARLAAGTDADALPSALAAYTAARLPHTTDVTRWSRRAGTLATWKSPLRRRPPQHDAPAGRQARAERLPPRRRPDLLLAALNVSA